MMNALREEMRELISESLVSDEERMKAQLGLCVDEKRYERERRESSEEGFGSQSRD